jgi:VWFA-related protein
MVCFLAMIKRRMKGSDMCGDTPLDTLRNRCSRKRGLAWIVACSMPVFMLTLLTPHFIGGQTPEASPSRIKVHSNLVVLDMSVTDMQGNIVTTLTKDDFLVYEDGVKQSVRTLDSPSNHAQVPANAMPDRNGNLDWGDAPETLLVLDELNTPFEEMAFVRDQLLKYLLAQPAILKGPTSLIAVNDYGTQELAKLTRNRDSLVALVKHRRVALPSMLMRGDGDEMLSLSFSLLEQIAFSNRGAKGRKNVIWIGRGFPPLDPMHMTTQEQDSLLRSVRNAIDILLAARVTISKIDPRANQVSTDVTDLTNPELTASMPTADPFADQFNFSVFIAQTGGKVYASRNDLDNEIQEGVSQASTYYTLSYIPTNSAEDRRYRQIDVRLKRHDLTVNTRQGYYASGTTQEQASNKELTFDLHEAAISGMDYNGVGLHVASASASNGKLKLAVKVDTSSLTFTPEDNGSEVTGFLLVVAAIDEKSKIIAFNIHEPHIEVRGADLSRITVAQMLVPAELQLPPSTHAVRVIVRDLSGRIGTANVDSVSFDSQAANPARPPF